MQNLHHLTNPKSNNKKTRGPTGEGRWVVRSNGNVWVDIAKPEEHDEPDVWRKEKAIPEKGENQEERAVKGYHY